MCAKQISDAKLLKIQICTTVAARCTDAWMSYGREILTKLVNLSTGAGCTQAYTKSGVHSAYVGCSGVHHGCKMGAHGRRRVHNGCHCTTRYLHVIGVQHRIILLLFCRVVYVQPLHFHAIHKLTQHSVCKHNIIGWRPNQCLVPPTVRNFCLLRRPRQHSVVVVQGAARAMQVRLSLRHVRIYHCTPHPNTPISSKCPPLPPAPAVVPWCMPNGWAAMYGMWPYSTQCCSQCHVCHCKWSMQQCPAKLSYFFPSVAHTLPPPSLPPKGWPHRRGGPWGLSGPPGTGMGQAAPREHRESTGPMGEQGVDTSSGARHKVVQAPPVKVLGMHLHAWPAERLKV